jgi:hypothetical protein
VVLTGQKKRRFYSERLEIEHLARAAFCPAIERASAKAVVVPPGSHPPIVRNSLRLRSDEFWLGSFYVAFFGIGLSGWLNYADRFVHLGVGIVSILLAGWDGARWRLFTAR